mgnify:CR=1 FL=1
MTLGDDDLEGYEKYLGKPTKLETPYAIHRPLKLGVSADFHPFGTLLSTKGYVGVGFRHPFASAINKENGGFRAHEECVLRGGARLREACCRLVDADYGNVRVCYRDV